MFGRKKNVSQPFHMIYNEFPWLWAVCNDWTQYDHVTVERVNNTHWFFWWLPTQFGDERGSCWLLLHSQMGIVKQRVARIDVKREKKKNPTIGDAVRQFIDDGGDLFEAMVVVTVSVDHSKGGRKEVRVFLPEGGFHPLSKLFQESRY